MFLSANFYINDLRILIMNLGKFTFFHLTSFIINYNYNNIKKFKMIHKIPNHSK